MNPTQNNQNTQNPLLLSQAFQNALGCAQGLGNPAPGRGGGTVEGTAAVLDPGFAEHRLTPSAPLLRPAVSGQEPLREGTAPSSRHSPQKESALNSLGNLRELLNTLQADKDKPEEESMDKSTLRDILFRAVSALHWEIHSQARANDETHRLLSESEDKGNDGMASGQEGPSSSRPVTPHQRISVGAPSTGEPLSPGVLPENPNAVIKQAEARNSYALSAFRAPKEPKNITKAVYACMRQDPDITQTVVEAIIQYELGFDAYPMGVAKYMIEVPELHTYVRRWAEAYCRDGRACGWGHPDFLRPGNNLWSLNNREQQLIVALATGLQGGEITSSGGPE